jgi:Domain of unknown function (DUF5069)
MQARDLRVEPPRRWNERVDGIPWLPRLIDKTRAAQAGTLGAYLFGQSPMDRSCLRALGLRHREFAEIVADARDDDEVVAAIASRRPSALERGRAWGERLPRRHRLFLVFIDLDDGYIRPLLPIKTPLNTLTFAITWAMKRLWPSRAAERNR